MAAINETLSNAFVLKMDTTTRKGIVKDNKLYSYDSVLAYWKKKTVYINEDIGNFSKTTKKLMNTLVKTLDKTGTKYVITASNEVVIKKPRSGKIVSDTTEQDEPESIDELLSELKSLTGNVEPGVTKESDFVLKVFEILFGDGAVPQFKDGERHFSYSEALEQLKEMNDVFTEHLLDE